MTNAETNQPAREQDMIAATPDADVRIIPNDKGSPCGKLADAEIHFRAGCLAGTKLIGFAVWESRNKQARNVTMPSRQYSVNGERRSFALLRPTAHISDHQRVAAMIIDAYARWETANAAAAAELADRNAAAEYALTHPRR